MLTPSLTVFGAPSTRSLARDGADFLDDFDLLVAGGGKNDGELRLLFSGSCRSGARRHLRGDVNYAWPTAEIAVMGSRGAAEIIYRAELSDPAKIQSRVKDYETRFANPFVAAERGFLDEVIMPHSTRKRIARALNMLRHKELSNPWKKHDNIPL